MKMPVSDASQTRVMREGFIPTFRIGAGLVKIRQDEFGLGAHEARLLESDKSQV
jgi:hypothetical protein